MMNKSGVGVSSLGLISSVMGVDLTPPKFDFCELRSEETGRYKISHREILVLRKCLDRNFSPLLKGDIVICCLLEGYGLISRSQSGGRKSFRIEAAGRSFLKGDCCGI